jgi:DNA repair exonuclease SbcCD nuclease subunit
MKIILTSDWHGTIRTPIARTDDIETTFFQKLDYIFKMASEMRTKLVREAIIVQAGDMGDKPREWYFLAKFIQFLRSYPEVKLITVYGQHDAYLYSETTKFATVAGVLDTVGLVAIAGPKPILIKDGTVTVAIYGGSWGQEVPEPKHKAIYQGGKHRNILTIHAPISNQPIYPGQEISKPAQFLKRHKGYDAIIVGDIHQSFIHEDDNGRFILNTGPLLRLEATEYNFDFKPSIGVLDALTGDLDIMEIPCKPAQQVLTRDHIEIERETEMMLDDFVRNIKTKWQAKVDIMENLQKFIRKNKISTEIQTIISEVIADAER